MPSPQILLKRRGEDLTYKVWRYVYQRYFILLNVLCLLYSIIGLFFSRKIQLTIVWCGEGVDRFSGPDHLDANILQDIQKLGPQWLEVDGGELLPGGHLHILQQQAADLENIIVLDIYHVQPQLSNIWAIIYRDHFRHFSTFDVFSKSKFKW